MLATCQSHSLQHPHTPVGCGGVSDATGGRESPQVCPLPLEEGQTWPRCVATALGAPEGRFF